MMKYFFSTATILFSSICLAFPSVGDKAEYSGSAVIKGVPVKFQLVKMLTEYNQSTDSFKQVSTTTQLNKNPEVIEEWIKAEDLMSEDGIRYLLTKCESEGGTYEIVSVKAGNFDTCKLNTENGYLNIGKIPFGIVKLDSKDWKLSLDAYGIGR